MTRTLLAFLVAVTMYGMLPGCEEGDAEDDKMMERRETPPPRAAPGTELGLSAGEDGGGDDDNAEPPATQGEDDG